MTSGASGQVGYFEANSSTCIGCGVQNTYLDGYGNTFFTGANPANFVNRGLNNHAMWTYNSNPASGIPANYVANLLPAKGVSNDVNRYTSDFLVDGNYTTPYNHDDFFLWPTDAVFTNSTPWGNYVVADSTSPTGYYLSLSSGVTFSKWQSTVLRGSLSSTFVVGTNLPDTGAILYMMAKCPSGTTSFTPYFGNSGAAHASPTFSCTTSYAYYAVPLTYTTGDMGANENIGAAAGSNAFYVAWFDVQPFTALNGAVTTGSGAAIPTGPKAGTATNDLVCYSDTVGTQKDCAGTATVSQTAAGAAQFNLTSTTGGAQFSMKPNSGQLAWLDLWSSNSNDAWGAGIYNHGAGYVLYDRSTSRDPVWFPQGMPDSAISGNSGGATAITQSASDNSTLIATDAFVKVNLPLSGTTGSIGGSSLAAGACASGTVAVTGATTSMAVVASPAGGTSAGAGFLWRGYVSSSGTVTVQVCAVTAGTPTAATYNVRVIQ
jgi:hypothetical protein